jgi:hypothetical protein
VHLIGQFTDKSIIDVGETTLAICSYARLGLSGLKITDDAVVPMTSFIPAIINLNISQCLNLSSKSMDAICSNLHVLRTLNVSQCKNISQESMDSFAKLFPRVILKGKK